MSDEIDLNEKFPEMRPVGSPPSLWTINGVGLSIYGRRDYDEETGTYVKTHALCCVFVPVFALGAYRVADAQRGWYFLGREPLSGLAKAWNWMVISGVACLAVFIAWASYLNSPDVAAQRRLDEAEKLVENGETLQAAQTLRAVVTGESGKAGVARQRLEALVADSVRKADDEHGLAAAVELLEFADTAGLIDGPQLFEHGRTLDAKFAESNPRGALAALAAVERHAPDAEAFVDRRLALLERAVRAAPEDPALASELAVIYESRDRLADCETLLAPHSARLGTHEGARILGRILAGQDRLDESHALLVPYTEGRLKQLHEAEREYKAALEAAQSRIFQDLEQDRAPAAFYVEYQRATEQRQSELVQEYVVARMKEAPELVQAQARLARESRVVPVALELGIVMLRRAQELSDPAARKSELERAEKTFLAVRGAAGESDEYRLHLGQVYYWLGRHDEGRRLFDALLEERQRSSDTLLAVSSILREVGDASQARELVEEAHRAATDVELRYQAALRRSILAIDIDDKIEWLRKSDPASPEVKATLDGALGGKALQEGRTADAIRHLSSAVEHYAAQTESAANLNNGALAAFDLYRATRNREDFDRGLTMLERALERQPGDSILLNNSATVLLEAALRDVIGTELDFDRLHADPDLDSLRHLHADAAARDEYGERLRAHAGIQRVQQFYDKLLLLAPKDAGHYAAAASLAVRLDDLDRVRSLARRVGEVQLDLADSVRERVAFYRGEKDAQIAQQLATHRKQFEQALAESRGTAPRIFAFAASYLVMYAVAEGYLGQSIDGDRLVSLAEEGHAAAPSVATYNVLATALGLRAIESLGREHSEFQATVERTRRSLSPLALAAIACSDEGPLGEAARKHPDIIRCLDLLAELGGKQPDRRTPQEWALFRTTRPEEADKVAAAVREREIDRLRRSIDLAVNPVGGSTVMECYWERLILGQEDEARTILEEAAAHGAPLATARD
ncbi:MAG: hypothetical protein WD069_17320 [Planctomycetales bacterium]